MDFWPLLIANYTGLVLLRMNKIGKVLKLNFVKLFFLAIVVGLLSLFVWQQMNGAAIWEDYYAKEVAKVINLAEPGDEIILDVHRATEVAKKNKVESFSRTFQFSNLENEICVKLGRGKKTCYFYFNNVDIVDIELKLAGGEEGNRNLLLFNVIEKQKTVERDNE